MQHPEAVKSLLMCLVFQIDMALYADVSESNKQQETQSNAPENFTLATDKTSFACYYDFDMHGNTSQCDIEFPSDFVLSPPQPYDAQNMLQPPSSDPITSLIHLVDSLPLGPNSDAVLANSVKNEDTVPWIDVGAQHDEFCVKEETIFSDRLPCRLCLAEFPNLRAVKSHIKDHLFLAPYECNVGVCQYKTRNKITMKQHIRCHSDQQTDDLTLEMMKFKGQFPCRHCSEAFPDLYALKGHINVHLVKRPYECNVGQCSYQTKNKSILLKHMRLHVDHEPYVTYM